jgi:[ribosomal protein S5]-alanine N-acetyltransferase
MNLIEILPSGEPAKSINGFPAIAKEVGKSYSALYSEIGFVRPWTGYLAVIDSLCVGTCGFKSPPVNGHVEIAYFTFPEYEGRGYATLMAQMLVEMARITDPNVTVIAQTQPHNGASTRILEKIGFKLTGSIQHPEDGEVWEWEYTE